MWGRSGVVVSAVDFTSEGWWSAPSLCHRVVSLDKKLYPRLSLSTCPSVYNGYRRRTSGGNPAMDLHPIQGGVAILSIASCYISQVKVRPCRPSCLLCNFTSYNCETEKKRAVSHEVLLACCQAIISEKTNWAYALGRSRRTCICQYSLLKLILRLSRLNLVFLRSTGYRDQ